MKNKNLIHVLAAISIMAFSSGPIYNGPELDYQPSIIRLEPDGELMVVFERISLPSFWGDMYVAFSTDGGHAWSTPQAILTSPHDERHPSLVQLGEHSFALFFLMDETDTGSYRLHRATSPDGTHWTDHGALELGWTSPGEINPNVIRETDGTLTMVYHRLSSPSYIARSSDDGVTWDTFKTQVSDGNAQLPRLTKRESDGKYLVTYQVGSSNLDIYSKVSTDPYDWSVPQNPLSTITNSHDSQPTVIPGGTFLVPYAQQVASVFDIFYRTSYDGIAWSEAIRVTTDQLHYDTQPHPLPGEIPGSIILAWSHQDSDVPYEDHDVWVETELPIPLPLWLDVDSLSREEGGTVRFSLDAGPAYAGRKYFLAGSLTGTSPGTVLPGGGVLPLNRDAFSDYILAHFNNAVFVDFMGRLDADGRAYATLEAPGSLPIPAGKVLYFAFTALGPMDFQSNPVGVVITQ